MRAIKYQLRSLILETLDPLARLGHWVREQKGTSHQPAGHPHRTEPPVPLSWRQLLSKCLLPARWRGLAVNTACFIGCSEEKLHLQLQWNLFVEVCALFEERLALQEELILSPWSIRFRWFVKQLWRLVYDPQNEESEQTGSSTHPGRALTS